MVNSSKKRFKQGSPEGECFRRLWIWNWELFGKEILARARSIRSSKEYKERVRLFKLDKDCLVCGSLDYLQVHHFTNIDYENITDSNCVVLCRTCHKVQHDHWSDLKGRKSILIRVPGCSGTFRRFTVDYVREARLETMGEELRKLYIKFPSDYKVEKVVL